MLTSSHMLLNCSHEMSYAPKLMLAVMHGLHYKLTISQFFNYMPSYLNTIRLNTHHKVQLKYAKYIFHAHCSNK